MDIKIKFIDIINKEKFLEIANKNGNIYPPEILERAWKEFSEQPPLQMTLIHETKKPGD